MRPVTAMLVICLLLSGIPPLAADSNDLVARLQEAEQRYREEGPEPVLAEFQALLVEARTAGDALAAATAQRFVGECDWLMGEFESSHRNLEAALTAARDLGDATLEGKTLNVLGLLAWDEGEFDSAIEAFGAASTIGARTGDLKLQGATLNNSSLVLDEQGDYHTSLAQYRRVLEIYGQINFPRGEGDTLGNIGGVSLLLGRYREAIDYYGRALAISESLNSAQAMSQDHGNLGFAYAGLGETRTALAHFDQALVLARQAGLAQEEGFWLRGKANAEIAAGDFDAGLRDHRAALDIYRASGADAPLLDALHDMGRLMLQLGDPISAQRYFEQALAQAQAMQRPRSVTQNQLALGDLQLRHQRYEAASALYLEALQRAGEAGEVDLQVKALLSQAALQQQTQDLEGSIDSAKQALDTAQAQGMLQGQSLAWLTLADAERLQAQYTESLTAYAQALTFATRAGDPELSWQSEYGSGLSLDALGRKADAAASLQRAVAYIEDVRNRLREKRFRSGYLQDKHQVYTQLVRLQLELERDEDAFDTAERLRSYSFSEDAQRATQNDPPQLAELRARIRQLQRAIEDERTAPPADQRQMALETFSAELLAAEQEFQGLLDDHAARYPHMMASPDSATTRDHLRSGEALLEYVVGQDHLMMFVLTQGSLHTNMSAMPRSGLHSRIELLRDLLLEHDNKRWARPAASLAGGLIQPALDAGWLDGIHRLYLVPHGVLNYLPFALLPASDGALVQRFEIAYLPSASALVHTATTATGDTVLAVAPARSRLQHAPEEARAVARLFEPNARTLQGGDATETAFRSLAGDYGVLHLATHGFFNQLNPMLSGLELEADADNDGLLEVHEILGLRLKASLVTLSACKTGMGSGFFNEVPAGDEFVGLTRAFLQAGSAAVLATLWEVDDLSTLELMKDFYTRLENPGDKTDKPVALARAQRALLASENYRHPYYWASFVLVGTARQTQSKNI